MISTSKKGFRIIPEGDDVNKPSKGTEFNVYYYDRDYKGEKRFTLSVTQKAYTYHDNGIVISTYVPMEDMNFNIVLENIKRYNDKRMGEWIKKIQLHANKLEVMYNLGQHLDLLNFVQSL